MNQTFGPLYQPDLTRVDTPAGEKCFHCEEEIGASDSGFILPYLEHPHGPARKVAIHRECHIRSIVGSIGHQRGQCSCHGGTLEDPPGVTRRVAALLAEREFYLRTERSGSWREGLS